MKFMFLLAISFILLTKGTAKATDDNKVEIAFSLVAIDGRDGGYCVLKASKDQVELITIDGALSEKQLKQAVRYMSYREQWTNSLFMLLILVPGPGEIISFTAGSVYPIAVYLKEQESSDAMIAQTLAGGWYGPLMEFLHRRSRVKAITGEGIDFVQQSDWDWNGKHVAKPESVSHHLKKSWGLLTGSEAVDSMGEKKGEKIIERLQVEPEFPGGCKHQANQMEIETTDHLVE